MLLFQPTFFAHGHGSCVSVRYFLTFAEYQFDLAVIRERAEHASNYCTSSIHFGDTFTNPVARAEVLFDPVSTFANADYQCAFLGPGVGGGLVRSDQRRDNGCVFVPS